MIKNPLPCNFVHACSDAAPAFVIPAFAIFVHVCFDTQIKISQSCLGQLCDSNYVQFSLISMIMGILKDHWFVLILRQITIGLNLMIINI